jgi:hypothetical protein
VTEIEAASTDLVAVLMVLGAFGTTNAMPSSLPERSPRLPGPLARTSAATSV